MHHSFRRLLILVAVISNLPGVYGEDTEPISPTRSAIPLFNGKNLDGLYTWLQDTKYEDPRKVFTVEDGMLHISGDAGGYICTKDRYKDYHLVVEYRWGERTWQSRKNAAKDTGVIVHATDPDGSFQNVFMAGIEARLSKVAQATSWFFQAPAGWQPHSCLVNCRDHNRSRWRDRLEERPPTDHVQHVSAN